MTDRSWTAVLAVIASACTQAGTVEGRAQESESTIGTQDAILTPPYYPPGYSEMTEAAAIFARENFGNYLEEAAGGEVDGEPPVYQVEDCQSFLDNAEIDERSDNRVAALEELAREIAKHRHYLSQLYPSAVFREPLSAYERAMLKHFGEQPPDPTGDDFESPAHKRYEAWQSRQWAIKEDFAKALEHRRRRLAPKTIAVDVGGGCGSGEAAYLVRAPGNGRVWMTTKFQWDLCRIRKFDPWDTRVCRWTEIAPDNEVYLSGRYVYQAKWPDGTTRRDVRIFDGITDTVEATRVTITKP